jgi:uncharacterized membrane protein YozB (DUF420 family)
MQVPHGFLGTRGDLLFDTIAVSLILIVVALLYAFRLARAGRYLRHRTVMTTLLASLAAVLVLFEMHLRSSGGPNVLFAESRYYGTALMHHSLRVHLALAMSTFSAWLVLGLVSLIRFRRSLPGRFGEIHRIWGRAIFVGFLGVAITGIEIYIVGLVL